MSKQYDVIVWGATGFTGKWVAKHLADHYPQSELSWAIAGRNADKLQQTETFLSVQGDAPDHLLANSNDEASLREMVAKTRVIISTVGPYAYYGSALVKVCAELGVDYVDLTGEVPWMRDMIDAYSETARHSGARIVHTCGFDSIPSDMGTFYTQQQAQARFAAPLQKVTYYLMKSKGGASGGTIASMMNIIEQAVKNKEIRKLLSNRYSLNPDPAFKGPDKADQSGVKFSKEIDRWTAPFVMAGVNTRVVRRGNALMDFPYGKDFQYSESMATGSGTKGYVTAKTISGGIKSMVVTSLTGGGRKLLGWFLPDQGEGPNVDPDNPGFYTIDFVGHTAAGERLRTRLHGDGDPGYGSTSKMLAESAICLAVDKVSAPGGFWTPASAMGDALLVRLQAKGGLNFSVVEEG